MTAETAQWMLPTAIIIMVLAATVGTMLIVADWLAGRRARRDFALLEQRLRALEALERTRPVMAAPDWFFDFDEQDVT